MKPKILYIEDEQDLGGVTKQYLDLMEFEVTWCLSGESAYNAFLNDTFNIVVIDIQLPDMDGFSLAKRIVDHDKDVYFLFLTARNLKQDKMKGLLLGAIDYIVKPFDIDELVLRMKNIVSKQLITKPLDSSPNEKTVKLDDVVFNSDKLSLSVGNGPSTMLTLREAELFEYFCKNKNSIIKREDILINVWGEDDYFLGRSLDVFVSRLRKLLSKSKSIKIENVYGVGFILSASDSK